MTVHIDSFSEGGCAFVHVSTSYRPGREIAGQRQAVTPSQKDPHQTTLSETHFFRQPARSCLHAKCSAQQRSWPVWPSYRSTDHRGRRADVATGCAPWSHAAAGVRSWCIQLTKMGTHATHTSFLLGTPKYSRPARMLRFLPGVSHRSVSHVSFVVFIVVTTAW
jgi:hypothetical protein